MGAYIINIPDSVDRVVYINVDPMDGKTYLASYSVDDLTPYTEPDLEREQKEIKVGDEVTEGNHNACALYENPDGTQVTVLKQDGTTAWWCKSAIHRTGRTFPEIATVLKKMRGEQDG